MQASVPRMEAERYGFLLRLLYPPLEILDLLCSIHARCFQTRSPRKFIPTIKEKYMNRSTLEALAKALASTPICYKRRHVCNIFKQIPARNFRPLRQVDYERKTA